MTPAPLQVAQRVGLEQAAHLDEERLKRFGDSAQARALRERDVAERMTNLGMVLMEDGTAHYVQFVKDDLERYTAAVKAAGVKAE